jgi:ferrous iron transport protein B
LKKAGTIIFISCGVIWFLSAFNWSMQMVDVEESMLASIGRIIAPIFAPLGWGDWKPAVATFNGLIAKEVVVGTFGILYGFGDEISEDGAEVWGALRSSFTPIAGLSFLVFQLLCAPCFAAIGAIRREMGSAKWTWTAILFQTGLAYAVSFIIYQFGSIGTNGFGLGTVIAILVTLGILYLLFRPAKKKRGVYGEVYSK